MRFKMVFPTMKEGCRARRKGWGGYWEWRDGTIFMHCADGTVLDIRQTQDVNFTLSNLLSDDWEIVG